MNPTEESRSRQRQRRAAVRALVAAQNEVGILKRELSPVFASVWESLFFRGNQLVFLLQLLALPCTSGPRWFEDPLI